MKLLEDKETALAKWCLDTCLRYGAREARVTLSKSEENTVSVRDACVDKIYSSLERSLSLALYVDARYGRFSTNLLQTESLEAFIKEAVRSVSLLAPDECRHLPDAALQAESCPEGDETDYLDENFYAVTQEDRMAAALSSGTLPYTEVGGCVILSVESEYTDGIYDEYIADTGGFEGRHTESLAKLDCSVTLQDQAGMRHEGYWWTAAKGYSALSADVLPSGDTSCAGTVSVEGLPPCGAAPDAFAASAVSQPSAGIASAASAEALSPAVSIGNAVLNEAVRRALRAVGPVGISGGKYRVVVEQSCASRLVSALIDALDGYSVHQRLSFLADALDCKVFSEHLTMYDRPFGPSLSGSRRYDAEGVRTKEAAIIENGVVKSFFVNTFIFGKTGLPVSADSITRPCFEPFIWNCSQKEISLKDILSAVGSGLMVTGFNGGNVNPATGNFSFGVEGMIIENGVATSPVRGLLMTGNLISLFGKLLAVGSDTRSCSAWQIPSFAFDEVDINA